MKRKGHLLLNKEEFITYQEEPYTSQGSQKVQVSKNKTRKNSNSMGNSHSAIGMILCCIPLLVHGPEVYNPTLTRFVANLWFPPFTFSVPYTFTPEKAINYEEQLKMLQAALDAAPEEKKDSAKDMIFLMLFETRQGSAGFWAAALGAFYAFTLPVEQRHPIHFSFLVLSIFMAMADANHGIKFPFGNHPLISANGKAVGIWFTPFWLLSAYCNYTAFALGRAAGGTCAA
eukprot:CAMPEP_0116112580 /NCGR_PEP_ID=MMETSP0327-20121206/19058_1 /TAXON_ID=44447 /ORGANISM="Pseudo-nitzschia delicatissima, Strain B596" /LENGTH=229 /DNA_ID=CAMNT_0003605895 /DNA_START=888 /DNA_END=1577 /DNA_ORIENTATION=-